MKNIEERISEMISDKSFFNKELRDFIELSDISEIDNKNFYHRFFTLNNGDITKINTEFNIFDNLDVESRTCVQYIEAFNNFFMCDLIKRIYHRGVIVKQILGKFHMDDSDFYVDFIKNYFKVQNHKISAEYYAVLPTSEKIKIFKSYINEKYNLKIYFFKYRVLQMSNLDQISYDFSLKKLLNKKKTI